MPSNQKDQSDILGCSRLSVCLVDFPNYFEIPKLIIMLVLVSKVGNTAKGMMPKKNVARKFSSKQFSFLLFWPNGHLPCLLDVLKFRIFLAIWKWKNYKKIKKFD
ncbi:unnamed protein product [Moneuplotes crassus]|uniref:Uncharacterized protein n=1 Tax=Euplotes crassus TaxID=5936 RepID=A0AAD2CXJ0_EUPCR|nr:unnamed protein product [Moneuplotes crassus]